MIYPRIIQAVASLSIICTAAAVGIWHEATANVAKGEPIARAEIRVIDGDTIAARGEHWRLIDMDAPEVGRTARCSSEILQGRDAAAHLERLLSEARTIRFERKACSCHPRAPEGTRACNYGRLCASLTIDGVDIAKRMIADGHAVHWPWRWDARPPKHDWCAR